MAKKAKPFFLNYKTKEEGVMLWIAEKDENIKTKSCQQMPKVAKRYEKFIKVGKICQNLPKDGKSGQIFNFLNMCSAVEKIEDQQFNGCIILF